MNAPLKMETPLERALDLRERGLYVFPSRRKDRHVAAWPTRATRDADTLRKWFGPGGPYADCWPSIFTGKYGDGSRALLVVDVDPRGVAAVESGLLDDMLPITRMHRTPRGGFHGLYTVPSPGVKSGANVLTDGVDIRSKGALIHFGEGYSVEQDEPIAEAPATLIAKCGSLASSTAPADRARDRIAPDQEAALQRAEEVMRGYERATDGERNSALHLFVCRVRESCATDADSTMAIGLSFAAEKCDPPYPEDEARATIRSAMRSAQNAAGSKAASAEDFPVVAGEGEAPAAPIATQGRKLPSMSEILDRRATRRPHLLKRVLLTGSYALMVGAPGEAKTFTALSLSHSIAARLGYWHGRPAMHGPVLYLAFEGLGGLADRLQALAQEYGPAPDLYVADGGRYDLCAKEGRQSLAADIAATFGDRKPVLIVVDTLARALALSGGDENSTQNMSAFNASVAALIAATGAACLVLHHVGKDKSKGARGSSALLAAVDTALEIEGGRIIARKQRDLEEGPVLDFKLRPVVVGEDAEGDPVLSCVVEAGAAQAKQWKPTGRAADAWRALCDLSGDSNAPASLDDLAPAFRAKAYPAGVKESTARMALNRALASFLANGLIEGPEGGPWRRALK